MTPVELSAPPCLSGTSSSATSGGLQEPDGQTGSLLGPSFSDGEIRTFLDGTGAVYRFLEDEGELDREIVDLIENERVVGLFQGRMEFGPRALGCRSIIGDARSRECSR